jgi:hypothetical protein
MLRDLTQVMKDVGKPTQLYTAPDGSRLLLFPYGARVLGLFAPKDGENFFWTNPALDRTETAQALFADSGWHNTGGDRTWIAPEVDTFFLDAEGKQYFQPRQLDMSDYALKRSLGGRRLFRGMALRLARPNCEVNLRLTKWFGPAANPLRRERDMADAVAAVRYAGYTQRVTLELRDKTPPPAAGLNTWNLIQLPPGGEMLIPLYARLEPRKYFGDIPAESVTLEDRLLRVKINFNGSHKIGLKAAALCGRLGYVYGDKDRWSLIVRNINVNPSGEYVDVPWDDHQEFGYCFQMCRVDEAAFGSFCEMEYHAPSLGGLPDPRRTEDISQTWAFRGPREAIDAVARKLLGAGISPGQ